MQFSEVIGQKELKQKLIRTVIENRISHAQMFYGSFGTGNLALALSYGQFINCKNKTHEDSCGVCPSCQKYQKLIHPDLHFVFPVASSSIKKPVSDDFIKSWRELLLEKPYLRPSEWYSALDMENKQGQIGEREAQEIVRKLSMKTYEAEYKVLIIWQPEKMNLFTANKLLKMIEEPPSNTLFLLIVEDASNILPTILSRTQQVKIPKIADSDLENALKKLFTNFEENRIKDAVNRARGNFLDALSYLDAEEEDELNLKRFKQLMRNLYTRDWDEIYKWVDDAATLGRERQKVFFTYALRMVRENFILNLGAENTVKLSEKETAFSEKFHPFINLTNAEAICNEFTRAQADIERNAYGKLVLLDMCLQVVRLIRK